MIRPRPLHPAPFAPFGDVLSVPTVDRRADASGARFATLIWQDGGADDEEFVDVAPFTLHLS